MTVMTVRLDDEATRQLNDLATRYPSKSAAVVAAIRQAWEQMQEQRLADGYASALADNPHYPYESAEEAEVLRARRRTRESE